MKTGILVFLILFSLHMAQAQQPAIHYTLGMSHPSTHLLEVELLVDHLPAGSDSVDFILPVWRPGRYLVLDFAGGIERFAAVDGDDRPLPWSKTDKSTWRVASGKADAVKIRYTVYANEFTMRTRGLNDEHAFVDGSSVFMYAERFRKLPLRLSVKPYGTWHVTTGLEGSGTEFSAPDYDYFVDCPLEIGTQKDFPFTVEGVPHVLSIYGGGNWDPDTLTRDIARIVTAQKSFWGQFPYKRYVFMVHMMNNGGGGTEHINSNIIGLSPYIFKNPDSYRRFLGVVSHEFFHTWNVKQLRPKGIHPYDYTKENYSEELWVAEGTTSYYGELLLARAGFLQADKFLEQIASGVQGDRQRPGNTVQSVAEASFDAWIKFWKGGEQSNNFEADYYDKGSMVSLLLDLEIRHRTQNARSLDDVMRTMFNRFPLSGAGYTLAGFQKVAEELAGGSLQKFFDNYVYGTAPLPWEEYLSYAGLLLTAKDSIPKPWLGVGASDAGKVYRVVAGSPAYTSGVDLGDEILAIDGARVRGSELNDRIGDRKPGDRIVLTVFHNDRLREVKVTLGASPVPAYKLVKSASADALQKSIYEGWLKTGW